MAPEIYRKLQKRLDKYSLGFPATESGVEIEILEKLFNQEDAELFLALGPKLEPAADIAARLGAEAQALETRLEDMTRRGLLFRLRKGGQARYAAIPFIHGLFEFQVKNLDPGLAQLMERYIQEANFQQAMQFSAGAFLRTIPVGRSLAMEHHVAAYEDAANLLRAAGRIVLADCICRKQKEVIGKGCGKLGEACFMFGSMGQYYLDKGMGREVSLEEGLEVLAEAARQGLVTQPGTAQNPAGMCNCCGDCCGVLATLNRHPQPARLVFSNHIAKLDQDACTGCGLCLERCQMGALTLGDDGVAVLNPERCIGCGLCTLTCPGQALSLAPKPEHLRQAPPATSAEQMLRMAQRRGLL